MKRPAVSPQVEAQWAEKTEELLRKIRATITRTSVEKWPLVHKSLSRTFGVLQALQKKDE